MGSGKGTIKGFSYHNIARLHAEVDAALDRTMRSHPLQAACNNGLRPLYQDLNEFVARKGKRIRPLLFILTHRLLSRKPIQEDDLIQAALALELFHAFILVHDDVIDRSDSRRGRPTLHKMIEQRLVQFKDRARTGVNVSIVMGDLLFAMACEKLITSGFDARYKERALSAFIRYVTDTGRGEMYDILHTARDIDRVKPRDIHRTYFLKTTKYSFECPMVVGAILAGASKGQINDLSRFARPIGLAFQIRNDLMEFERAEDAGKLIVDDLFEGKKTLLLRTAYDKLGKIDKLFLQTCFDAKRIKADVVERIRHLVIKSGAFAELQREVVGLFRDATSVLKNSSLDAAQRKGLENVLEFLKKRTLSASPSSSG
jgi:geranylgeranyl diphosphate synthase type I